jgi:SAM-dependent methyltransferase
MKCKICSTKTKHFEDDELKKTFFHCSCCELIFLDKKSFVTAQNEKKQYDQHNNSLENEGYVKMFDDFLDFSLEGVHVKTVLDFGSGPTPVLAELLKQRGFLVDYFDKFYQPKKIYENKSYDLITTTEVFEHLENPKEVLNTLTKHLNPDGIISLMTLFHTNKQEDFLKWWYRRDPTHITFFTPKSIEFMASECGLKVLKTDNKRVIILQKK